MGIRKDRRIAGASEGRPFGIFRDAEVRRCRTAGNPEFPLLGRAEQGLDSCSWRGGSGGPPTAQEEQGDLFG
ncbi:MAG TPA: hypothetical protein PK777_00405 [Thermoguttaceae bacterium]|nr:hypothetical protein [Thermoguttaceae bacterium]